MTRVNRSTDCDRELELESDWRLNIADHHEHAAELALVKMCEQPLQNTRWINKLK